MRKRISSAWQRLVERHHRVLRRLHGEVQEYNRFVAVTTVLLGLVLLLGIAFILWKSDDNDILVGLGTASIIEPDSTIAAAETAPPPADSLPPAHQTRASRPDSAAPERRAEVTPERAAGKAIKGGEASYYGSELQGRPTASGEPFDPNKMTAAHPSLPIGSRVRVTNLRTGKSVVVRVNDRGPFARHRVIDLSRAAASRIGMVRTGKAHVRLELLTASAGDGDEGTSPPLGVSLLFW